MKIVFLSNFLLHHQTEFCETMYKLTDGGFTFVATSAITEERIRLGYHDYSKQKLPYYQDVLTEQKKAYVCKLVTDADAVIIGSAPWLYVEERIKQGKLTFIYSERIFKDLISAAKTILRGTVSQRFIQQGKKEHVRLLCASAYLPKEMKLFRSFENRMYRWGYFPPLIKCEEKRCVNTPIEILWCGRLIKYKRPEYAIKLAEHLRKKDIKAHITIIGTGSREEQIKKMIQKRSLIQMVSMLGAMPPENVRKKMYEADIFIYTANKQEGWGAVQNEAMNGYCAVVSSNKIGSTPFLIENGVNGIVFKDSDYKHFCSCVEKLCSDKDMILSLQKNAYNTIDEKWNAIVGAERLFELISEILQGHDTPFITGPCSKITS